MRLTSYADFAIQMPEIAVYDLNQDRLPDIALASSAGLTVWYQTGTLQFPAIPSQQIPLRSDFQEDLRFNAAGFADLNNDKLLDYCRIVSQGGQSEFKTVIEIHLGSLQSGFSPRPSKRIVLNQFAVGCDLVDLNGNGSKSLITATVPVSRTSMVKAFVVRKMPVELSVFEAVGGVVRMFRFR